MEKILITFLVFFLSSLPAKSYQISKMSDKHQSFIIFTIKDNEQEIAKICLFDPKKNFTFFSNESDPSFFNGNVEKRLEELAQVKKIGKPICVALGSFKESEHVRKIYPGYFWESIALLLTMPPYFEKVNIINTQERSKRFYLKVTIGDKYFYSLMVTEKLLTIKEAKIIFTKVKELNLNERIKPIPISDFPVKLISFDGNKVQTIYVSDNIKRNYSCLFIAGK